MTCQTLCQFVVAGFIVITQGLDKHEWCDA
jgi:hypothetical protein